jgi:hypothetical protein
LIAAMYPRPVMVEFADRDGTTTPAWHERACAEVVPLARTWQMEQKWVRDSFSGLHEIGGMRTFEFLDQWLRPQWGSARLPDSDAVIEHPLGPQPLRDTFRLGTTQPLFAGLRLRLSRGAAASAVVVRYGSRPGARELGEVRLEPAALSPRAGWYNARIAPQTSSPDAATMSKSALPKPMPSSMACGPSAAPPASTPFPSHRNSWRNHLRGLSFNAHDQVDDQVDGAKHAPGREQSAC